MTKQKLERGMELQRQISRLCQSKEDLEQEKDRLLEDMNRIKGSNYVYWLKADAKEGKGGKCVGLSAKAAYSAVCTDIADIDKELEQIRKEFSDL
ncbi:MAG: hypothetical protein OSJ61_26855 [Lachnospiraceae bacterium]|nr:hypothetical protein [Lachnospiraceae bacterium]